MNQSFSQVILTITSTVKSLFSKLFSKKLGVVIAAVALLFMTTGCNPPAPNVVGSGRDYEERVGQQSELYDEVQPNTGGMNQHNDDFRYDRGESQDKADQLIRNADKKLDRVQGPKEYVDNLKDEAKPVEWTKNSVRGTKERLENVKDDVTEGTQKGTRNLKANTERAAKNAQETIDNTVDRVGAKSEDVLKSTQRAVDNTVDRAADRT
jgi:ElaB/YqjD/DUF883 family membrane-anchored ribosome-binding protein